MIPRGPLALAAICAVLMAACTETADGMRKRRADYRTTATQLLSEVRENRLALEALEKKYGGKILAVTGYAKAEAVRVDERVVVPLIGEAVGDALSAILSSDAIVGCTVIKTEVPVVSKIRRGDEVSVQGRFDRVSEEHGVVLRDCAITQFDPERPARLARVTTIVEALEAEKRVGYAQSLVGGMDALVTGKVVSPPQANGPPAGDSAKRHTIGAQIDCATEPAAWALVSEAFSSAADVTQEQWEADIAAVRSDESERSRALLVRVDSLGLSASVVERAPVAIRNIAKVHEQAQMACEGAPIKRVRAFLDYLASTRATSAKRYGQVLVRIKRAMSGPADKVLCDEERQLWPSFGPPAEVVHVANGLWDDLQRLRMKAGVNIAITEEDGRTLDAAKALIREANRMGLTREVVQGAPEVFRMTQGAHDRIRAWCGDPG